MDSLRQQVRACLPTNVLGLMDEIEVFAGLQIDFSFNDLPPPAEYPNAAACRIREDGANVLLREGAPISAQDMLHELLHIRRYWIDRVPQIEPIIDDDDYWDTTSRIEETLEHLIIVPREGDFGFSPRPVWNSAARSEWSQYPWPNHDPFARRLACYLGWLNSQIISDPEVRELARACLIKEGEFDHADRLHTSVMRRLASKPKCLLLVVRALGIRRSDVRLSYLDVKKRVRVIAKLPLV